jgi:transcriptional regulator with XRE-family HTH domain
MRTNVPNAMRRLRVRHRLRQEDLGRRAGLSRDAVSRAECGALEGITIGSLSRLVEVLDATLVVEIRWQGAGLDRLIDREHAHLQEAAALRLTSRGWLVQAEVSFNHYGDRGSCDLVAWHPGTRTFLVVEVKTRIGNLQELLLRLNVKARLGGALAQQLGWPVPRAVVRALVVADGRTSRRVVERHATLFSAFALRGRVAMRWIGAPSTPADGLLWFEEPSHSDTGRTIRAERVRTRRNSG